MMPADYRALRRGAIWLCVVALSLGAVSLSLPSPAERWPQRVPSDCLLTVDEAR